MVPFVSRHSDLFVTRTLASGNTKDVVMSRVEFAKAKGYGNAEAKREYPNYLLDCGRASNAIVSAAMASGKIVIVAHGATKDGGNIKYLRTDSAKFLVPATKASEVTDAKARAAEATAKLAKAQAVLANLGLTAEQINTMLS